MVTWPEEVDQDVGPLRGRANVVPEPREKLGSDLLGRSPVRGLVIVQEHRLGAESAALEYEGVRVDFGRGPAGDQHAFSHPQLEALSQHDAGHRSRSLDLIGVGVPGRPSRLRRP